MWADTAPALQTTLIELLDRYLAEVTSLKKGAVAESSRIRSIKRYPFVKYSIASISSQQIARWRDERLKVVSGSTVAKELGLLHHVFSVAIKEWGLILPANPVGFVRKPPQPPARDRILNSEQRTALIKSCDDCRNPWVTPVVVFALETGARRGEILGLKWADVDLQNSTAKLDGKTGLRTIPLSPACLSLLKSIPRSLSDTVFPVTVETLKQAYQRAVHRAGIRDFTFHDLRHDALTKLAKQGLSVLELRAISGHKSADMLQRYVSISASELAVKLAAFS